MRGGARPGAGRKSGGLSQAERAARNALQTAARKVRKRVLESAKSPLEVMIRVMEWHYDEQRYDKAACIARDAAPYIHPRLAATQVQASLSGKLTLEQLILGSLAAAPETESADDEPAAVH